MEPRHFTYLEPFEEPDAPFSVKHLRHLQPFDVVRQRGRRRLVIPEIYDMRGSAFALTSDEERFVKRLLAAPHQRGLHMRNLWVFRVDQRRPAGDFVAVDCSGRDTRLEGTRLPYWDVFAIELKMNTTLSLGGGGCGNQFALVDHAIDAALRLTACALRGPLPPEHLDKLQPRRLWKLVGSREDILTFFRVLPFLRSHRRRTRLKGRALLPKYRELSQITELRVD